MSGGNDNPAAGILSTLALQITFKSNFGFKMGKRNAFSRNLSDCCCF